MNIDFEIMTSCTLRLLVGLQTHWLGAILLILLVLAVGRAWKREAS